MKVGEVRVAEDTDFTSLRNLCEKHEDWKVEYNKNDTTVWTKNNDLSDFKMLKVYKLTSAKLNSFSVFKTQCSIKLKIIVIPEMAN